MKKIFMGKGLYSVYENFFFFILIFYFSTIHIFNILQPIYVISLLPVALAFLLISNSNIKRMKTTKAGREKGFFYLLLTIFFVFYTLYFAQHSTLVIASSHADERIYSPQPEAWTWNTPSGSVTVHAGVYWDGKNYVIDIKLTEPIYQSPPGDGGDGGDGYQYPTPSYAYPTPSPACQWSCSDWTPSPSSQSCGTTYTQTRTCTATNSPCDASNKPSTSQSATGTSCPYSGQSCSGSCTPQPGTPCNDNNSCTSGETYTVSDSSISCSGGTVCPLCKYSFSMLSIDNFDLVAKTGNYVGKDYIWKIKASDASSLQCPASLTYAIPTNSIVTIGSCEPSTGIYPANTNPPSGSKINSFTISRGKSADVFKVYVKPSPDKSCTFSFGINAPDGKATDPIFTVTSPSSPAVSGSCNKNGVCESGENQESCPNDCKTIITLNPKEIQPGETTSVKIDVNDGRYAKNNPIQLNLFIDGTAWETSLCPISNVKLNPTSPPSGIKITSNDRQVIAEATCKVPTNIGVGTHTLRVIPTIF